MKINTILIALLLLSFLIVIINDLILSDVPEIFSRGDEIGALLSNLSLAYISSYIFYYVVVVLQERKDAANLNETVHILNLRIVHSAQFAFSTLKQGAFGFTETSKQYSWKDASLDKIQELCDNTNPQAISLTSGSRQGLFEGDETFGEVIYRVGILKVEQEINTLFLFMKFLTTDHIRILNSIRGTSFYSSRGEMIGVRGRVGNTTMSTWAKSIYEYIEAVKKLETFDKEF
jgi:hypothetical protein